MRIGLVVGGASGIGAASADALAEAGITVAVADVQLDRARATATSLSGSGHRGYATDISSEADVIALFDAAESDLGSVAVLVIAAGVPGYIEGKRPSLRDMTVESWDLTMAVNARGTFLCVREMLRRRSHVRVAHGRVILIGSMAAQTVAKNSPASYIASKGAVFALMRPAAVEAASVGLTVNAIAPGAIDTPMLRQVMPPGNDAVYFGDSVAGRVGSAREIARAVAFIADETSDYINGACIDVNGGLFMR